MYTLKKAPDGDGNPVLLGPINKRAYASYAPKRRAFAPRNAEERATVLSSTNEPLRVYRAVPCSANSS